MERTKIVDRKEMIEVLKHCMKDDCSSCPKHFRDGRVSCEECNEGFSGVIPVAFIQDVIDMLEPVSPISKSDPKGNSRYIVCGSCDAIVNVGDKYCRICGREVKWNADGATPIPG